MNHAGNNYEPEGDTVTGLDVLRGLGFLEVGAWELDGGNLFPRLRDRATARNVLYAFVSGTEVLYLGVSTQSLGQRMRGYARPGPTQRTNLANHAHIRAALSQGHSVAIWVLEPTEVIPYHGVALNIAAGLEGPLIARLQPPWNRRARGRAGEGAPDEVA